MPQLVQKSNEVICIGCFYIIDRRDVDGSISYSCIKCNTPGIVDWRHKDCIKYYKGFCPDCTTKVKAIYPDMGDNTVVYELFTNNLTYLWIKNDE